MSRLHDDQKAQKAASLIHFETNGFFIFLQNSNLELKVFVEELLIYTDYSVTLFEIRVLYLDAGLEKRGLNFIYKN